HGRGRGFRGAGLEVHAELGQDVLRIGEDVHQVRDRRPLVAADITYARLQQGLGDRQDALAAKLRAGAEPQRLDLFGERPLGHGSLSDPRAHTGTSASTRSGLPEPFTILSGGAMTTAPVGGS